MVHGDCSSRGCYAMTDEQIAEIYALARKSFAGDQQWFQVQAYPFRMTALSLAKHRNNPNVPFWRMLKDGNDHFEVTRLEPKVNVCEYRYVFDAELSNVSLENDGAENGADLWRRTNAAAPSRATLSFNPTGWCPAYQISPELAVAIAQKIVVTKPTWLHLSIAAHCLCQSVRDTMVARTRCSYNEHRINPRERRRALARRSANR